MFLYEYKINYILLYPINIGVDSEVVGAFIKLTETLIQQKLESWDDVLEKSNARMGE